MSVWNVCRPVYLYNDFLPPTKETRNWQWRAFGYYDGVSVGENIAKNNAERDSQFDYHQLWVENGVTNLEMNGTCLEQTIWIFRTEDAESNEDSTFWNRSLSPYLFLFVSLLQVQHKPKYLDNWEYCREFEAALNDRLKTMGGGKALAYQTLDNSDMVLMILCNDYDAGTCVINQFHSDELSPLRRIMHWELTYSFTIASFNRKLIEDDTYLRNLHGVLHTAYIYAIEKRPGGIGNVYTRICEAFDSRKIIPDAHMMRSALLGCNDEQIYLHDVSWSFFLTLFRDNDGCLNHSSDIYQENLIGVTTIIGRQEELNNGGRRLNNGRQNAEKCARCLDQCKELYRFYTSNENDISIQCVLRDLIRMINSLSKFEMNPFHDYLFQNAFSKVHMAIMMALSLRQWNTAQKHGNAHDIYMHKRNVFLNSAHEFIRDFNLYIQNSVRADRQFTQSPDFNIRMYETPVKFGAFYNAFLYRMQNFLNGLDPALAADERHHYEFLAYQSSTDIVKVRETFSGLSFQNRMILLELPEKESYSPDMMMFILAHEVSHFVGSGIRNRKKRYTFVKNILSRMVTNIIYRSVYTFTESDEEFDEIQDADTWKALEQNIGQTINEWNDVLYMQKLVQQVKLEGSDLAAEEYRRRIYHTERAKRTLLEGFQGEITGRLQDSWWSSILDREEMYALRMGNPDARQRRLQLQGRIENALRDFNSIQLSATVYDSGMKATLDYLFQECLQECLSDIIAIVTLKVDMKFYIETVVHNIRSQGLDGDSEIAAVQRVCLVIQCMINPDAGGFGWDLNLPEWDGINEEQRACEKFMNAVWDEMNQYCDIRKPVSCLRTIEDRGKPVGAFGAVQDSIILNEIEKYLLTCKRNLEAAIKGQSAYDQQQILDMYHLFSTHTGELNFRSQMLDMQETIDLFIDDLAMVNEGCINQETKQ